MKLRPNIQKRLQIASALFLAGWLVAIYMLLHGYQALPPIAARLVVVALLFDAIFSIAIGGSAIADSMKDLKRSIFDPKNGADERIDERLAKLKAEGSAPVAAIAALRQEFGLSLAEAKQRFALSPAWKLEVTRGDELHCEIIATMEKESKD